MTPLERIQLQRAEEQCAEVREVSTTELRRCACGGLILREDCSRCAKCRAREADKHRKRSGKHGPDYYARRRAKRAAKRTQGAAAT